MPSLPDACNKRRILVITGTTGFDSLVKTIDEARGLESDYDITLQIGEGRYTPRYKKFFDFDRHLKLKLCAYDFFITHAGAGTLFTLLEQGRRVLVVPNTERADKHQRELAAYVGLQGWCAVCNEVSDVVQCIADIEHQTDQLRTYAKVEFNAEHEILRYIYGR